MDASAAKRREEAAMTDDAPQTTRPSRRPRDGVGHHIERLQARVESGEASDEERAALRFWLDARAEDERLPPLPKTRDPLAAR